MVETRGMRQTTKLELRSFPPLGGAIDKLDKTLSLAIYKISLHSSVLEFLLSVIGHQHGIPITAMALHCLTLAAVAEGDKEGLLAMVAVALTLIQVIVWGYAVANNCHEKFYTVSKLKMCASILSLHFLVHFKGTERSRAVASWYFCSYLFTQGVVVALKMYCVRMRPAHALEKEVEGIKREIGRITFRGAKGWTVFESFPSGDAAGAMVFSCVLKEVTGSNWSYLIAVIASYGRMYLFAHHLLDVTVGCLIAKVCTDWIMRGRMIGGWLSLDIVHVLVAIPVFIVYFAKVTKLRRMKLPVKYVSGGNSVASWGHPKKK